MTLDEARAEALRWMETGEFQMRSCWNCNEAHEHLKARERGVILCFACGHWFYAGHDLTEADPPE